MSVQLARIAKTCTGATSGRRKAQAGRAEAACRRRGEAVAGRAGAETGRRETSSGGVGQAAGGNEAAASGSLLGRHGGSHCRHPGVRRRSARSARVDRITPRCANSSNRTTSVFSQVGRCRTRIARRLAHWAARPRTRNADRCDAHSIYGSESTPISTGRPKLDAHFTIHPHKCSQIWAASARFQDRQSDAKKRCRSRKIRGGSTYGRSRISDAF